MAGVVLEKYVCDIVFLVGTYLIVENATEVYKCLLTNEVLQTVLQQGVEVILTAKILHITNRRFTDASLFNKQTGKLLQKVFW